MGTIGVIPTVVVGVVAIIASMTDAWKYKISNLLTVPLLFGGIAFHATTNGWSGFGFSMAGAAFGFGVLILFYVLGAVGAGDVKFVSGIGAWLGLLTTAEVFFVAGLVIGVCSVGLIIARDGIKGLRAHVLVAMYQMRSLAAHLGAEERVEQVVKRKDRRTRLIPLAVMITIGLITVFVLQYTLDVNVLELVWRRG
jgi:prepilin peptidase CpaA